MESLEQIQGMPPGMYHRYGVLDDDMEDEEDDSTEHAGDFGSAASANSGSGGIYNADLLVAGMAGLEVDDPAESSAEGADGAAAGAAAAGSAAGEGGSAAAESAAAGGQAAWSLMAHPGECPGSTRVSKSYSRSSGGAVSNLFLQLVRVLPNEQCCFCCCPARRPQLLSCGHPWGAADGRRCGAPCR